MGRDCTSVRFREMKHTDIPNVLQVEESCYDFPWSEKVFFDCKDAGYYCVVIETGVAAEADATASAARGAQSSGSALSGHGILMYGPGEAHILNLCVVEALRRQGVARRLLQFLIETASVRKVREIFLEVRESNEAAIGLYESMGFNRISVRSRYYDSKSSAGGREDAMIYALTIYDATN